MLHYKKLILFLFTASMLIALNGCTTFAHQKQIKTECATSPVLIANLTHSNKSLKTQLPTGEACPSNEVI